MTTKATTTIRSKTVQHAVRDWLLGLGLFVVMAFGLSVDNQSWGPSNAAASSPSWSQLHEMATPATLHPDAGYLAAIYQPSAGTGSAGRTTALVILGLTFSLMFSFNLFIWRHLRRVSAVPRSGSRKAL